MKKTLPILIALIFSSYISVYAQANIAAARLMGAGATVTVTGVVTNGSELGIIRYMQDNTAGMAVYDAQLVGVNRGDSITVTGVLTDYNGLLEIQPVTSFVVHGAGILPLPISLTPTVLGETNESLLIKISGVTFANAGVVMADNTTYMGTSGGNSFPIYVRTGSPLTGQILPVGNMTLYGISSEFTGTYQVLPRDLNDFETAGILHIISPVSCTNIVPSGFTLSWLTDSISSSGVRYGKTPNFELGYATGVPSTTNHSAMITGLNASDIVYAKCFSVQGTDTAFSGTGIYCTQSLSTGKITTYFNKPIDPAVAIINTANYLNEAIDDTLIAYIDRAISTLDITIYDFNNTNISNISTAINAAYNRGVRVRVISDGSLAATNSGITDISSSIIKIPSPTTSAYNIMHNKFVIIDANHPNPNIPIVWTGATNWQQGQINEDPNNVVIFQDKSLAKTYTIEFNEMWGDTGDFPSLAGSRFGPFKTNNTPHEFNIAGKRVECYFSPSDNVNTQLINTINTANTSLQFASMVITKVDVAQAIVDKVSAGVEAYGITHTAGGTLTWNQLTAGMQPNHLLANSDSANTILHHKYLIVDQENNASDPLVWTGSHNWSNNADTKNDENTVVIHDQDIANQFYQEFHNRFISYGGIALKQTAAESNGVKYYVFPNPSTNQTQLFFELHNSQLINKTFTLDILSIEGKLIESKAYNYTNGNNVININTQDFTNGLYIFKITAGNYTQHLKFIKN